MKRLLSILMVAIAVICSSATAAFAASAPVPLPENFRGQVIYEGTFSETFSAPGRNSFHDDGTLKIVLEFDGEKVGGRYWVTTPGQTGGAPLTGKRDGNHCNLQENNPSWGIILWDAVCDGGTLAGTYVTDKAAQVTINGEVITTKTSIADYAERDRQLAAGQLPPKSVCAGRKYVNKPDGTVRVFCIEDGREVAPSAADIEDAKQAAENPKIIAADEKATIAKPGPYDAWVGKTPMTVIGAKTFLIKLGRTEAEKINSKISDGNHFSTVKKVAIWDDGNDESIPASAYKYHIGYYFYSCSAECIIDENYRAFVIFPGDQLQNSEFRIYMAYKENERWAYCSLINDVHGDDEEPCYFVPMDDDNERRFINDPQKAANNIFVDIRYLLNRPSPSSAPSNGNGGGGGPGCQLVPVGTNGAGGIVYGMRCG